MKAQTPVGGKERLISAADECFRNGGYGSVGVAQILEKAGVQAPTLYHHFGDKEALYLDWATSALRAIAGSATDCFSPTHSLEESLACFGEALLKTIEFDIEQLLRDVRSLARPESQETILGEYMQSVYNPLCSVFMRAAARKEATIGPVGLMVDIFLSGLHVAGRARWQSEDPQLAAAQWWAGQFVRGCAAKPPPFAAIEL